MQNPGFFLKQNLEFVMWTWLKRVVQKMMNYQNSFVLFFSKKRWEKIVVKENVGHKGAGAFHSAGQRKEG